MPPMIATAATIEISTLSKTIDRKLRSAMMTVKGCSITPGASSITTIMIAPASAVLNPSRNARKDRVSFSRDAKVMSTNEGSRTKMVASNPPLIPPARYPTNVASRMKGPGVASVSDTPSSS